MKRKSTFIGDVTTFKSKSLKPPASDTAGKSSHAGNVSTRQQQEMHEGCCLKTPPAPTMTLGEVLEMLGEHLLHHLTY